MASVSITTRHDGLRLDRVVFRQLGKYVAGAVEATLDANRGLAALPSELPAHTTIEIPQPSADAPEVEIIRLFD